MGETAGGHGLLKYAHPLTLDETAASHPRVRFIIAHVGSPWILDAVEVMAKNENVYIDVSGLLVGRASGEEYLKNSRPILLICACGLITPSAMTRSCMGPIGPLSTSRVIWMS